MKRKLLKTALCITSVLACSIGLTACKEDSTPETPETHKHAWGSGWTVTAENKPTATTEGKATRTCGNDGCDATEADKEYTLPALDSTDYSKTDDTATCTTGGTVTYTYNKNGVSVGFDVATAINPDAHKYGNTYHKAETESEGHLQVCEYSSAHKTAVEAHDTLGADGDCSKCGYKTTVKPPEPSGHIHTPGEWINTDPEQHYKLCAGANCDNPMEKLQAGDHDADGKEGVCSVCGYDPTPTQSINGTGNATVTVGGGNKAKINAFSFGVGYYTYTYEGNKPITVKYTYSLLGTGEVTDTVTLSWEGQHSFTAQLSTKSTCVIEISSDSATPFNATITATFSETDPNPVPELALNKKTTVNATYEGKIYAFTATEEGSYTLDCTDSKAVIYLATDDETPLKLPYTFTLNANQTVSFVMSCNDIDNPDATYEVSVAEANVHRHLWTEWEVTEENLPTLTEEGKATRICENDGCDAEISEKEYVLPALTSDDYTVTDDTATVENAGTGTYTYNKEGVKVSFTAETPAVDSIEFTVTVTGAGEGVTVKLGKYTATTDEQGVASVKAEKQGYDVIIEHDGYSFTAGTVTVANCEVEVALPEFKQGNTSDRINSSGTITGAGIYTTTISSKSDDEIADKYAIAERYFSLENTGGVKAYTVKILSANTTISPDEAGYSLITGVGESYYIVLEEGESTLFNIASNDEDVTADYSYKVVFEIIESEAPEAGVYDRPIRLENGVESSVAVTGATDKVYFRLDFETFGKYATVSFGDGVTVYSLGLSKNGEGAEMSSGENITVGEHNPAYLYAVSTGASITLKATPYYVEGMKEKPFDITLGEENSPEFDIKNGVYEQWYKLEVDEDGTYIVKPDASHASLEIYNDVNSEAVSTASEGSSISVRLTAGTPVYIRAKSGLSETYNFTVTEFSDADKGTSKDEPLELTVSGDYTVYNTHYYKFTPDDNCKVVISYNNGVASYTDKLIFYVFADESYDFSKLIANSGASSNKVELFALAGETYYLQTSGGEDAKQSTFNFAMTALKAHDHVITISGADDCSGITVKVTDGTEEIASGTTDSDGSVTLNFVPDSYKIVLENLPDGYGYFADYALTALNDDETSYIDVQLYALSDYSVTFKMPDGTGAEGITVTFTNGVTGTFTVVTDENGVAKITQLPPMVKKNNGSIGTGGSYTVKFELPENLSEDYAYTGGAVSLTSTVMTSELKLSSLFVYVLTLVDGEGNALPAGITVDLTDNGKYIATAVTNENGVAEFGEKVVAGEYSVSVDSGYTTDAKTSATQSATDVVCTQLDLSGAITGSLTAAEAVAEGASSVLTQNATIITPEGKSAGYYKFAGAGTYTITTNTMDAVSKQIYLVYLNGTATANRILASGKTIAASAKNILQITDTDASGIATGIKITLSENDYIVIAVKGAGLGTVTIAKNVNSAGSYADITDENSIGTGSTQVAVVGWDNFFKFTASETQTYVITLTNVDASQPSFTSVFLNGFGGDEWSLTDPNLIIDYKKQVGAAGADNAEILETDEYGVLSFSVTLQAGDFLVMYVSPGSKTGSFIVTVT